MNALDTALQHLAAAASALEHTSQPTLKDIKESRDKAKAAHEILDASTKLLGYGIYTVTQEPGADTPLFQPDGQPAAGVHTPDPPPEPKPLQTLGCIDVEVLPPHPLDLLDENGENDILAQDRAFDDLLNKLENAGIEEGLKIKAWKKAKEAWVKAWELATEVDGDELPALKEVYDLAVFALEVRKPISWAIPTEQEVIAHQRQLDLASGE